jgi:TetR/AcrR family transcriptional repressor of nem operon
MNETTDTPERILDVAERLVQTRGYDGFSFADIADEIGIRKASIHHHFATKGDLGLALLSRFRRRCREAFAVIETDDPDPIRRLRAYARVFEETFSREGRMCLCGMLAAGHATLPEPMREELIRALADHEDWLDRTIRAGQKSGQVRSSPASRQLARTLFSSLEGALLLSRVTGDMARLRAAARTLLASIEAEPATAR